MRVPFYQHDLGKPELDAIAEVFTGPILTTGAQVAQFEKQFAEYVGQRHCLGVTSCTGAMHLSLIALGIGPGDEVITTPMTFIATAEAIIEAGAKPVFVDVEPDTGNIDVAKIESAITPRTKAILPVHLYGLMADMRAIRAVADRHGLRVVEDAAHCIEGQREGIRPGQLGDTACFSFFATKNIACGEGGALVTNDMKLFQVLRLQRLHGMDKTSADRFKEGYQHWDMVTFGWKYNMDNIHAAMLLPQMKRINDNLRKRHRLAQLYVERLSGISGVQMPSTRPDTVHARHLFTIWVDGNLRDKVMTELGKAGISAMVNYRAIHLLSYFRNTYGFSEGAYPQAERIGHSTITLPFYPQMPEDHIDIVADELKKILGAVS